VGARRIRREQRRVDMAESRRINGPRKTDERARRDVRILGFIKKQGSLPYTPVVMSWLSEQLDKPARLITQQDVQTLVSPAK
jgi:hypothetical protein